MLHPGGYALDDLVMRRGLEELVRERNIKVIVETGINEGKSTVLLAKMAKAVVAVDNDGDCLRSCAGLAAAAGLDNLSYWQGSSPQVLRNLKPLLPDETLYFLDAHWEEYWPLLDEIRALRKGSGIIVLHDMLVPGRPDLGFDSYHGQALSYEYVRPLLNEWSPTHKIFYNDRTEGTETPRGVGYIFPR